VAKSVTCDGVAATLMQFNVPLSSMTSAKFQMESHVWVDFFTALCNAHVNASLRRKGPNVSRSPEDLELDSEFARPAVAQSIG
jgi:hypothetical protein